MSDTDRITKLEADVVALQKVVRAMQDFQYTYVGRHDQIPLTLDHVREAIMGLLATVQDKDLRISAPTDRAE